MPKKLTFEEVAILAKELDCPAKKVDDARLALQDVLEELPKTAKWDHIRETLHGLTFTLYDATMEIGRLQSDLVIDRYRDVFDSYDPSTRNLLD